MTKNMVVGVTGSRRGMNALQRTAITQWLRDMVAGLGAPIAELHHGDCVGVDEEIHYLAVEHRLVERIVIHPPLTSPFQANCMVLPGTPIQLEITAPMSHLDRDKAIIQASYVLLAVPPTTTEQVRSGTWYTVRYARHRKRPVRLFLPDGRVLAEDHDV